MTEIKLSGETRQTDQDWSERKVSYVIVNLVNSFIII